MKLKSNHKRKFPGFIVVDLSDVHKLKEFQIAAITKLNDFINENNVLFVGVLTIILIITVIFLKIFIKMFCYGSFNNNFDYNGNCRFATIMSFFQMLL